MLAYLPHASWGEAEDETWRALEGLAGAPGNLHPLLAEALHDKLPPRRALAACLAARLGTPKQKDEVRKLLTDPAPRVRLRAAQGFLTAGDNCGVPTLIDLLETASVDIAWQAEELLHWLAEQRAPIQVVGVGTTEQRRLTIAAWRAWYEKQGSGLNVAQRLKEPRRPGLYFVYEMHTSRGTADPGEPVALGVYGGDGIPRGGARNPLSYGIFNGFPKAAISSPPMSTATG